MQLSFIIPTYNGLSLTKEMLASLMATIPSGLDYEIILADDASTDGTRDWMSTLTTPYRSVLNEKNLGYAATCNLGASVAAGEFLMFLNNDLLFNEGWLEPMLDALKRHPKYGAIGNRHYRMSDNSLHHAGVKVMRNGRFSHIFHSPIHTGVTRVAAISAATLLVRRSDFGKIGGFDEIFHNGGEDYDLCFRLQREGLQCGIAQGSSVRHHVSATRGAAAARDDANLWLLAKKWGDEIVFWGSVEWGKHQKAFLAKPWKSRALPAWRAFPFIMGWVKTPPKYMRRELEKALAENIARWEETISQDEEAKRRIANLSAK